jgi:hypothetical protein
VFVSSSKISRYAFLNKTKDCVAGYYRWSMATTLKGERSFSCQKYVRCLLKLSWAAVFNEGLGEHGIWMVTEEYSGSVFRSSWPGFV